MNLHFKLPTHYSRKKVILLVFLVTSLTIMLYFFLVLPNLSRQNELAPLKNCLFAHRGLFDNTAGIPENSLLSFQKAIDAGYGIELDVQLTKDKVPVVLHDYNLKRPSGKNIQVSKLTYEQLSQYRLFDSDQPIPSLEEALELIDGQVPVMIELKVGLSYTETCRRVAAALKDYHGYYCIISFSPLALGWFRQKMPQVIRGQLSTNFYKDHIDGTPTIKFMLTHLLLNFISRPDFISYNCKYESNPSLNLCKNLFGTPVAMWTIRDQVQYDEISRNYNMIVFDSFIPSTVD